MISKIDDLIRKKSIFILISGVLFTLAAILLFWKIPYGWGGYDEAFYISLPYRFIVSGDAYVADEWNLAQFSSFLLILPVKLFSIFRPDMEGVILFFRVLYSVIHILVSFIILMLLKKEGIAGIFATLIYMMFIPFNIMNFSYDAVGLTCITLCVLLIFSHNRPGRLIPVTVGILFAFAVLCNPYLVVLFAVYTVSALVLFVKKKQDGILCMGNFLSVLSGIAVPAVLLMAFVLTRTDISLIIQNLPCMFNDPTHGKTDILIKITETLAEWKQIYFPYLIVWILLTIIQLADKNRSRRSVAYIFISVIVFALGIAAFVFNVRVNCFMLPFAFFGLNIYIQSGINNRRVLALWFSGLIYGIFMWAVSDQKMYIISMAVVLSDMASVLFIRDLYRNNKNNLVRAFVMLAVVAQLGMQVIGFSRATHWESVRVEDLNAMYDRGPLKGLRTTKDKVDEYNLRIEDISGCREEKDGRIAFMTLSSWEYLYAGRPYGSFSPWLGYTDDFITDKYIEWCGMHPDKTPEEIYFPKNGAENWSRENIEKISDFFDYDMEESNMGITLISAGTGEKK